MTDTFKTTAFHKVYKRRKREGKGRALEFFVNGKWQTAVELVEGEYRLKLAYTTIKNRLRQNVSLDAPCVPGRSLASLCDESAVTSPPIEHGALCKVPVPGWGSLNA